MLGTRVRAIGGLVAVAWFVGCGSGEGGDGVAPDASTGKSCLVDPECDDENPCTLDSCGAEKVCVYEAAPDGDSKDQEPGDCRKNVCKDGLLQRVIDNGDVPDDKEVCTQDVCENGAPLHKPMLDKTKCTIGRGSGTCQKGVCFVLCSPATSQTQCDDLNPCTSDACLPCDLPECGGAGRCGNQGLSGMPTPGVSQVTGDCRERRCVEGVDTDAVDNYDIPKDGNDCTEDLCKLGAPVNDPLAAGTACSNDYVCDGKGSCVECVSAANCEDWSDSCSRPACKDGYCTSEPEPAGTALPAEEQFPGDCRIVVCNGTGSSRHDADPTDLPNDDNPCTKDECVGTSPRHSYQPAGTSCGEGGGVCDAFGRCCTPRTCASQNLSCGQMSDGCGKTIDCGTCTAGDTCSSGKCGCKNSYRDGQETDIDCGGPICTTKCAQGLRCIAGSDCASGFCVDNVCCNSACSGPCKGCTSAKTGQTTGTCGNLTDGTRVTGCPTTIASSCGTTGYCKGGACDHHPVGTVCLAGSCTGGVETKADTCDGQGQCVDNGTQSCTAPYICSGTKCGTCSDGLRNGNETDTDCGGGGSCGKCAGGKICEAASDCQSNICTSQHGTTIKRCCDRLCPDSCWSCGSGTCTPIPNGQDPGNAHCGGPQVCNGAGACRSP
jgi:hypothetical protein